MLFISFFYQELVLEFINAHIEYRDEAFKINDTPHNSFNLRGCERINLICVKCVEWG